MTQEDKERKTSMQISVGTLERLANIAKKESYEKVVIRLLDKLGKKGVRL